MRKRAAVGGPVRVGLRTGPPAISSCGPQGQDLIAAIGAVIEAARQLTSLVHVQRLYACGQSYGSALLTARREDEVAGPQADSSLGAHDSGDARSRVSSTLFERILMRCLAYFIEP
jgi:hypothetical protein